MSHNFLKSLHIEVSDYEFLRDPKLSGARKDKIESNLVIKP